jgi:arylsulfatase A-like enzyme
MKKRPNILLITSDQQRGDAYGFENPLVKTPHLDWLAQQGTRFGHCISPNLVCMPSRASILTGLLPLTHGVWDNGVDLENAVGEAGFAGTLAKAGYDTAFLGKAHFTSKNTFKPTGTPECRQSVDRYGDAWFGPYMGFEFVELMVTGHINEQRMSLPGKPAPGRYERWLMSRGINGEAMQLWKSSSNPAAETGAFQTHYSGLPPAWHTSTWVADRSIHWLEHHDRSKPFCIWASFPDPHRPFDCPAPWNKLYDPKDMSLPTHRTRDFERRPWWHKAAMEAPPAFEDPEFHQWRAEGSRVPPQSDAQLAQLTANYYGMVSLIDHNVGRMLESLESLGLAEDTLVVYTTDHGEMLGHHGLVLKGPFAYEDLLRVGLIVRGPGVKSGQNVQEPVSTLDLAKTFYDMAGVAEPAELQGSSLKRLLAGDAQKRDAALAEWHVHPNRCGVGLKLRIVRTRTHKCTFELDSGAGELYDLIEDPHEMQNRFDDPAYKSVRKELEDMMRARPGKIREDLAEPVGMS